MTMQTTALAPAERAVRLLGGDLTERSLRQYLEGLSGVDAVGLEQRAAGLATRSIKTSSSVGPKPCTTLARCSSSSG